MGNLEATLHIVGGLAALLIGADLLVRNSARLGAHYGLRPIVIGVTIVAFGTSAPEFLLSFVAALQGQPGFALGNVLGSNVANLALVMGAAAVVAPIIITSRVIKVEYTLTLVVTLIACGVAIDGELSRLDGLILSALFVVFIVLYGRSAVRADRSETATVKSVVGDPRRLPLVLWIMTVVGFVGLAVGAHIMIQGAEALAVNFGVREAAVGATLLALSTSLPELVTSMLAAFKKEDEIAVGNILGSNIFNLLFVLGPTVAITPLPVDDLSRQLLMPAMLAVTIMVLPMLLTRRRVGRAEGLILLVIYAAFTAMIILRSA